MNGWISVKERVPPGGQEVLIFDSQEDVWVAQLYYDKGLSHGLWLAKTENNDCCTCVMPEFDEKTRVVTHWRPLPELPKE